MNTAILRTAAIAALAFTAACATSKPPGIEVTRFHLDKDIPSQVINIEPADGVNADSLEFRSYATTVGNELTNIGLSVEEGNAADIVASVKVFRGLRAVPPKSSPFVIGFGGGSYGGRGGVGAGASVPVGGSKGGEIFVTELEVKLIRRSEKAIIWEGTASRSSDSSPANPAELMQRLANALFTDFPGDSGKTITIQ